jgi:disulfide bond formation protein DsbB
LTTQTVTFLFALLAVVAQVGAVAVVVAAVTGRTRPLRARVGRYTLGAAAGVALTATLGSLYLSEVAEFPPCRLCWFQRIAMYPLVPLLGLAAVRRDQGIRLYGLVIAGLGVPISIWHLFVERFPNLEGSSCDPLNPCSIIWVERFGYLTIPAMALSGFVLVIALLSLAPLPESP